MYARTPKDIQIILRLFLVINMYCQLCKTCFLVLLRVKTFNPIYQKPQLLSIIARLICTMRIDLKVPCKIYPIFFQAGTLKTVVCHTYKSEKIRQVPWKNLDSFYRVDFTRYPSNHFSGCRLNRCINFANWPIWSIFIHFLGTKIPIVAWPHFCRTQLHSPPNGDFCPRIWAS